MAIHAVLYTVDALDQAPDLSAVAVDSLSEKQLLWIDLSSPDDAEKEQVAKLFGFDLELLRLSTSSRQLPSLISYGAFFRVTANAVSRKSGHERLELNAVTLVVGSNYVVSVHDQGADFLEGLRKREQGDSNIGSLSAESFSASLLDWLLDSYFHEIDKLVHDVDRLEITILGKKLPGEFLESLVKARRRIAALRRALKSHRDVFYGLARPDFTATEKVESRPHFEALNKHYERAEDELESARDLVIGSFELLSTRSAQKTNDTMRVLTFVTVLMGLLALVAGILGMNFELPLFQTGTRGFVIVAVGMFVFTVLSVGLAYLRRWL